MKLYVYMHFFLFQSESTETHSVVMTTKDNEKYKCFIPQVKSQKYEVSRKHMLW